MFSWDSVCLSVCLSVHAATRQSDIWALNVNSSKTVKAIHTSDLTHMFQDQSRYDP